MLCDIMFDYFFTTVSCGGFLYLIGIAIFLKVCVMPCALPMAMRQQVAEQYRKGQKLIDISEHYGLSYSTVRKLCKRLDKEGAAGLTPRYSHCGIKPASPASTLIKRAALWLKRLHPGWGAALICLKLKQRYRRAPLPCERTLQRWFRAAGLYKAKSTFPAGVKTWASRVHDTWQVDAKEKLVLGDGQKACYLSVVDEKSGALLDALVFPPLPHQ